MSSNNETKYTNLTIRRNIIYILNLVLSLSAAAQTYVDFTKIDKQRIASDPSVTWQQFGPGGSGNNYYLFWHPTDPNVVFQGPNMYNAYRSIDQGKTYEGILDYDGPGYSTDERGPIEINTPEFSRQNADFGFCTRELKSNIFETNDRGKTWVRRKNIESQINGQIINTIAVDPSNDNIWYMGSGTVSDANTFLFTNAKPHGFNSSVANHKAKIWKTTDKGSTWADITPAGINTNANITRVMVHPGNTDIVFAATTYGFYKSIDGGSSWTAKNSGFDNSIIRSFDMHYNKVSGDVTLYVIDLVKFIPSGTTIAYNGGIYKSTDEGENWSNINSDMPLDNALMNSYAIKSSYYGIALADWFEKTQSEVQSLYPTLPAKMLHSVSVIRVNPAHPDKVLVLNNYKSQFTFKGGMMWRTDNGGDHWFVTFRNGSKWNGDDKALWVARNNPTSKNINFRAQDEWEGRDPYDQKAGATVEFNSDGSVIMFQVAKVVCISTDDGDNWEENDEQDASGGDHHWVGAGNSNMPGRDIITDARNSHLFLCSGENSIWKTTDDGDNVRANAQAVFKMNIPSRAAPEECSVSSMVLHPLDKNTMYSVHFRQAFTGKLMKSTDGGANWVVHGKVIDPPSNMTLSKAGVTQFSLIIDPDNINTFYVCIPSKPMNDITETKLGNLPEPFGVYRSTDGGVTFSKVNNGFSTVANSKLNVEKLMLDPVNPGVLYAAVSRDAGGLYRLDKNSDSWKKVNTPSGVSDINDVYVTDDKLYISCGLPFNSNTAVGGVWVSENRGNTWKQIFKCKSANLVRVAPYDPDVLLVSIPSSSFLVNPGTYRSLDGGSNWTKINVGNAQSDRLNDLEFDVHQRGVYWCSTYGAGFYKGTDPSLINTGENVSGSVDFVSKPTYAIQNENFELSLDYSASKELEIFALVYRPDGSLLTEVKKTISAGSSAETLSIEQDGTWSLAAGYQVGIGIRPVGGSFNTHLDTKVIEVEVIDSNNPKATGVETASENLITLSPNPTTDLLLVSGLLPQGETKIQIYSLHGKTVREVTINNRNEFSFKISELNQGLYVVCIQGNGYFRNMKFIKQ